jgi:biotin carboxyl carrier protein
MNSIALLQISATDPHGIIITAVSVLVVFASMAILHISYYLIGKVVNWHAKWSERNEETTTSDSEEPVGIHDEESYVITIRRKGQHETINARKSPFTMSASPIKETSGSNRIESPLDGNILAINVKVGDKVKTGQPVAILEAMKMENEIQAETDGIVTAVSVQKGDHVALGDHIITIG